MRYAVLVVLAGLMLASSASAAPFTIGTGFKPSVAVDAAGTAYMAWYGPESGTTSLQFCRVPRGATACDLTRTIPAPGTSLSRPHVSVSGAVVRIVQYRYSVLPPQVFVFTSVDGGNSFDAGRSAGQAPFDEAVFGPGDTITGATNAWQNGGVIQQLPLSAGSAGASWAQLYATDHLYNGTVGLTPASTLLAIFTANVADASYKLHTGAGDPNNAATWGPEVAMGYADYPRLASGAPGLFVLAGDTNRNMFVRRWNGAGFDAPVTIGPGDASESDLYVDAGGRLHAVYPRLDVQGNHLQHSVSDDGVTWQSGSVFVQAGEESALRVAAAADHVGVAVWSTSGVISASAVGPGAPVVSQPPPPPPPPADPVPEFAKTVVVTPSGTVRVRLKGSSRFVALTTLDDVPFGATIDTRRGAVVLRARTRRGGPIETVRLFDGMFAISQSGNVVNFTLNEPLAKCPKRASAAQKKPKSRKLWGDGKGAFRTSGRYSAATVRGTRWLVQDTCKGTLTRVTQGSVSVRAGKKTVIVRAGRKYTARPRR
ncbi:hypothetical protein OJ998_09240 [Solirubrobacter taibaiensis]|nr:hypothetical protein [Solirubrobacter taibaiensis]